MRLLLIGGWGQLGTDLALVAEGRHELVRPRHDELDVMDPSACLASAESIRPDVIVNAAAFHKVELCEEHPDRAFSVNAVGAWNVARAARAVGARTVYISTDYVFDGEQAGGYREDDRPNPVNVYGLSKLAGERATQLACPDSLVVRGSGLFGHAGSAGKGGNFVDNIIARARAGEVLSVVDDQIFAPTATRDMAERILLLLERQAPPAIYHATNSGACSWYLLARRALDLIGIGANVTPRPTGDQPVRRPRCSVLLDTRGPLLGLPPARSWEEALQWYLAHHPRLGAGGADAH